MRRVSACERDPAANKLSVVVLLLYENVHPQAVGLCGFYFIRRPGRRHERSMSMTREEKNAQIRKEARATAILFCICFLWHVGCAYLLSGTGATVCGLPLWWILSTPGVFVIAVVGVVILLKKVFVNFSLDDEYEESKEEVQA